MESDLESLDETSTLSSRITFSIAPEEDLRRYVPDAGRDPDADHFCKTFFANTYGLDCFIILSVSQHRVNEELSDSPDDEKQASKHDLWSFLGQPSVYKGLPGLSPAVIGVTFLEDAEGLVLSYDYNAHALSEDPKVLERDVARGTEVRCDEMHIRLHLYLLEVVSWCPGLDVGQEQRVDFWSAL